MWDFKAMRGRAQDDVDALLEAADDASSGLSAGVLLATGFAAGVGAGLLLGLLLAPRSGAETRQALRDQFSPGGDDPVADEVEHVLGVG